MPAGATQSRMVMAGGRHSSAGPANGDGRQQTSGNMDGTAVAMLTERNKAQGQLIQAWKHRLKQQNEVLMRLHREREEQMRLLTSQLLLLEANLRRKQTKIDGLLNQRDRIITEQKERIRSLESELDTCRRRSSAPLPPPDGAEAASHPSSDHHQPEVAADHQPARRKDDSAKRVTSVKLVRLLGRDDNEESLEDSDSAVVIEDDHLGQSPTFTPGNAQQIKVIRSISDVVACARANICCRTPGEDRPDVGEGEEDLSSGSSSSEDSPFNQRGHKSFLRGSLERTPVRPADHHGGAAVQRSLSTSIPRSHCINHRSVTRPRDVKSRRARAISRTPPPPPEDARFLFSYTAV